MVKFKYKGTVIDTPNLEKKLRRMKLTLSDILIIEEESIKEVKKDNSPLGITLYKYIIPSGYRVSIYKDLPYKLIETKYY